MSTRHWSTSSPERLWGLHPSSGNADDYPLVQAQCKYRLVDVYLQADLTHTFTSKAKHQSDVTYSIPLPPDASVHSFKALIDGRVVKGVVKEKGEAQAAYQQAVSMNKKAALLQQENIEIFKLSLGNVSPRQNVAVQISFVSLISHEGVNDTLRLTFPTSIAPRYGIPPEQSDHRVGSLADASTLEFSLSVEVGATITTISSPSHPISSHLGRSRPADDSKSESESESEFDVQKAYISLSSTTFLDKDIVIVLSCRNLDKQRCVVESSVSADGLHASEAYALTFVPRFKLPPLPRQEYLFLVDRSGSMGGGKMHALRSSLQIMLKSLPSNGSSFNLISFGTKQSSLWATSRPYTEENVRAASAHVDNMTADHGGTEIKGALVAAFRSRLSNSKTRIFARHDHASAGVPTSVFVLTDGQCYDLEGVQSEIRSHVAQATRKSTSSFLRVFCMGIGDASSKGMCDAIARAGNGAAVFVGEMEKPDQKLMSLIRASAGPPIENLRIDWGLHHEDVSANMDANVLETAAHPNPSPTLIPSPNASSTPLSMFDEGYDLTQDMKDGKDRKDFGPGRTPTMRLQQYPPAALMSPLVPGSRVSYFAIVTHSPGSTALTVERSRVVKLNATVQGQPLVLECPVSPITPVTSGTGMSTRLLHLIAARHLIQGHEDAHLTGITEVGKQEVLRLGLEYGLASSQTSFIAIDEVGRLKSMLGGGDEIHQAQLYGSSSSSYQTFALSSNSSPGPVKSRSLSWISGILPSHFDQRAIRSPPTSRKVSLLPPSHSRRSSLSEATTNLSASIRAMPQVPAQPSSRSSSTVAMASQHTLPGRSIHAQQYPAPSGVTMQSSMVYSSPIKVCEPQLPLGGNTTRVPPPGATRWHMAERNPGSDSNTSKKKKSKATVELDRTITSSIESLAREQAFDGSFLPSSHLFHLLTGDPNPSTMPSVLKDLSVAETVSMNLKRTIWSTLLVIAYLQANFAAEEDTWSIFSEKALLWTGNALAQLSLDGIRVDEVLQDVQEVAKGIVVKR